MSQPSKFYHGTSAEAAMLIQQNGFDLRFCGCNAGCLLGPGVYCSTKLRKAMGYAERAASQSNSGGVVLELEIDLGRCLVLKEEDELMDTWQYNGFDSAWSPGGANHEGLEENCIWSKSNANLNRRITILGCIPVSAVDFNRHFLVHNGWLSSKHGVQPPIPIGSQAEIRGLRQREDLNGATGVLAAYVPHTSRFEVRLDGSNDRALISAANLFPTQRCQVGTTVNQVHQAKQNFTYAVSFVCGILLCRLLLRQQIIMEALTISTEVMHVQAGWLYGATTVRRERFSVLRWLLCFVPGTLLCVAFCGRLTQGIIRIADYFMGSARSARLWIVLWEWGRITKMAAAHVVRACEFSFEESVSAAYRSYNPPPSALDTFWEQFVGRPKRRQKKLSLSEFSSACFDWLKLSLAFLAFFIVIFTFFFIF